MCAQEVKSASTGRAQRIARPLSWVVVVVFALILATFVNFNHKIIPDRVSWGGMAAGFL